MVAAPPPAAQQPQNGAAHEFPEIAGMELSKQVCQLPVLAASMNARLSPWVDRNAEHNARARSPNSRRCREHD